MCSDSKAGSYVELIDFLFHSTLGFGVKAKKKKDVPWIVDAENEYRGTSLIVKRTPLGPYRRPMPRVLGGS